MKEILSVKELLSAGAHFGHKTSLWNPKMRPYIFGKHNGSHIIDIKETLKGFLAAYHFLTAVVKKGGEVLFVGTKPQARESIQHAAQQSGAHYVTEKWVGGTLTNFETIHKQLAKMLELEKKESEKTLDLYSKKEEASLKRELNKLRQRLGGIRNMSRLPNALVIVDPRQMKHAVREAKIAKIPAVALIDTDSNPDGIDIPVPINDDAMRVIQLVMNKLAEAIINGKAPTGVTPLTKTKSSEIPDKTDHKTKTKSRAETKTTETAKETTQRTKTKKKPTPKGKTNRAK